MKVTFIRERLQTALAVAMTAVSARSVKPILSNVRIDAGPEGCVLSGNKIELGVRVVVADSAVEESGSALIPGVLFDKIVRKATGESLTIEIKETKATIKVGRDKYKLPTAAVDEFPAVEAFDHAKFVEVESARFEYLSKRTLFSSDDGSDRYAMGGVNIEIHDNVMIAVATDGRRLSKVQASCNMLPGYADEGREAGIIPTAAMGLIAKVLHGAAGTVRVFMDSGKIKIDTGCATVVAALLDGRFPKWREVLPDGEIANGFHITAPAGVLLDAVQKAALVTALESHGVDFQVDDGQLVMSMETADVGQSRVEIPVVSEVSDLSFTLDHRFVEQFLRVMSPDSVVDINAAKYARTGVLFTDGEHRYIVMPMMGEGQK